MPDPTPAYRSRLINYLDEIRRLRRARQTWRAIAEYLGSNYGVQITAGGVHIFFKRATRRKQVPLGFEDPSGAQADGKTELRPRSAPVENTAQHERQNRQTVSMMPIKEPEPHPWFGSWTPEQGINYTPKN